MYPNNRSGPGGFNPNHRNYTNGNRLNSDLNNMNLAGNSKDEIANHENGDNASGAQTTPAPQNEGQAQYMGGYSMIRPNESRRSKLQSMAQKEEADLQQWREAHKPGPINLDPAQLGGGILMAEARQMQMLNHRQSKYQKKLKREEYERKRKEEEEAEIQRMKEAQREKANRLEEKRLQQERQRREQYKKDQQAKTHAFLQKIESSQPLANSVPMSMSSSVPTSSWAKVHNYRETQREEENQALWQCKEEQRRKSEILEEIQKQKMKERERELQNERRRVNEAFLDRLQRDVQSGRKEALFPVGVEAERGLCADAAPEAHRPESEADGEEEDEDNHEWTLMKLQNAFPFCERSFLEEIVTQCNGDYRQAYQLLQ
ncbi:epithelial-stromal interaction protein 1 [Acipenser oxyrinchus oxyrinchus]|uniref:Epithelial-stromal interaction protein 1 n=1 Tax=Acipenser oxyrinchus oxyrinchus TaxID=40147 RepID=A0AAD8LJV2_ACIOX|nr:epithelial-stromal interaction protein 1 [Acipenser oxyrinchus oxyrinchus]